MSCNNNKFYGNRIQASRGLFTNRIDSINKNNNITIGGCADEVIVQGDLVVNGQNCASCLKTNNPDVNVNVSGSAPPSTGQVLVALDAENAEWQPISGSGMGDVSGPASSTNNEIVRFDGTTGKLIKSDSSVPTTIDDNGNFSGPTIETSENLVALGENISKTVGSGTTVIGNSAGENLVIGAINNTFVGSASGNSTTSGNNNTFVGDDSGALTTTANNNTFIGSKSGHDNTTGDNNTFVGISAGRLNTNGEHNTFIGGNSGLGNIFGQTNTFVGFASGLSIVNGSENTILGSSAGLNMSTQSGCVLIGNEAGRNNTLDNRLMIDNSDTNNPLIDGNFSTDTLTINGDLVVSGNNIAKQLATTGLSVNVSGSTPPTTGQALIATSATSAEWQTISGTGSGDVVGPASSTNNEIVRFDGTTGKLIKNDSTNPTTIDDNGLISGPVIETSRNLVSLGQNISKTVGPNTTVIGNDAGQNLTAIAQRNTFVGSFAGNNNSSGSTNTFVGNLTGFNNSSGSSNTFVGNATGSSNSTGIFNTYLGFQSSQNNNGNNNTTIGYNSGQNMTTQSGCVLIGNETGQFNTINNRLMIDNTNTNIPLLDGNFAGNTLQVNGQTTLGQTGNTSNVHAINGSVDPTAGTVNQYLVVSVNGTQFKIPLHNLV